MKISVIARRISDGQVEVAFRASPLEMMAWVARWDAMEEQTRRSIEMALKKLGHGVISGGTA